MRGCPNSSGGPKFSKQKLVNVFLFLTEGISGTGLRNVVYKFRWDTTNLVKPSLILDLPGLPGTDHNSGKLVIGPNCYLYAVIGELQHNNSHARFQWWMEKSCWANL
jgi:aldose sugar dehydrogenase